MLERLYNFIRLKSGFVQKTHNWLASRIDHVLASFIKSKISNLRAFAYKLSDQFMLYIFSVGITIILYCLAFYSSKFVWLGYSGTDIGKLFIEKKSNAFILTQGFFSTNNLFEIAYLSIYCAIFLLVVLSGTRLVYINRYLYEFRPKIATSFLWGIPLAKLIAVYSTDGNFQLSQFLDLNFILFFIPTVCILHPTMQFVNWLMPEVDELYKNPAYILRRLEVERAVHRINNQNVK